MSNGNHVSEDNMWLVRVLPYGLQSRVAGNKTFHVMYLWLRRMLLTIWCRRVLLLVGGHSTVDMTAYCCIISDNGSSNRRSTSF